jgi:hypothetical protein
LGAPLFSAVGRGEREALGVSVGLRTALSSGVAVGVGDALLRFDFVFGVGLGDGVGEIFLCLGEAVGDGVGVAFFVERVLCFRCGDGVGVGARIFLIFVPNDSSPAPGVTIMPKQIVANRKIRRIILIGGNNQWASS